MKAKSRMLQERGGEGRRKSPPNGPILSRDSTRNLVP